MEFIETIGKLVVRYHSFFEEGIVNTLIIAAFTVFFGTIFGTLMSRMRMSKILPLKWLAVAYIEFIRGTPLMVQDVYKRQASNCAFSCCNRSYSAREMVTISSVLLACISLFSM